jgi:PAS domain-containing protein
LPGFAAALLALVVLLAVGALLINLYIEGERERDLLQWDSRLGLVADTKVDAVARLLGGDRRELEDLARNASLQLYLWQVIQLRREPPVSEAAEPAQQVYLRNLIVAAAERGGYLADVGPPLPANVPRATSGGMALFDAELRVVASTPGFASLGTELLAVARQALTPPAGAATELVSGGDRGPLLVQAVPVTPVSGMVPSRPQPAGASAGVLVAVRSARRDLYPLLDRGPSFAEESETLLLVPRDDSVLFLSPTRDGAEALVRSLPIERDDVAEVAAVTATDRFASAPNHRGVPVLQVSRRVRGQGPRSEPWVLAQQVSAVDALSTTDDRRSFLLAIGALLLLSIAALAVAAWRHGSSVRARAQADELAAKAAKLERQTDLLHTVTDNIDALTVLINRDQEVLFTNRAAAAAAGSPIGALVGRRLAVAFGHSAAAELAELGESVRRGRAQATRVLPLNLAGARRSFQTSAIPVERIGDRRALVLLVLNDVTELQLAEQQHADLLRSLVATLSDVVDLHDPFSAHHATRMAEVATAVARELGLPAEEQATLGLAATLANIGKIMLPAELLTKTAALTPEDRQLLRRHVEYSLELLKGLDFEGPVLDTIAQKQELLDGTGYPQGLSGEQLTLAGRILSVANAFVALVSARAWRQGVSIESALEELMRGAGTQYDRRVIAALFHVAENRRDWSQWSGSV